MGGLKINTHAQVIDVEGHIIEGLYAAGRLPVVFMLVTV